MAAPAPAPRGLPTFAATPTAAVVVVSYASAPLLQANLAGRDWAGAGLAVVVVDNDAGPAAREVVRAVCAAQGWTFVAMPGNPGFGAAVNRGLQVAGDLGAAAAILLNPDARAEPGVLARLAALAAADPGRAFSPRVLTPTGRVEFAGSHWRWRDGAVRGLGAGAPRSGTWSLAAGPDRFGPGDGPVSGWLSGACLAAHLSTFAAVGGFDERYFLYWEDVDLCHRWQRAGVDLAVAADLTVVHDEGGTHGGDTPGGRAKSDLYYRWNCRNRLAFAAYRLPRRDALRWLLHTPAQSTAILLRGGRRQLLTHPRAAWATLSGSAAGAALVLRRLARRDRPWEGDA